VGGAGRPANSTPSSFISADYFTGRKCLFSNNMIIQTSARCCTDNIGALCDIYKFSVKDLVDLPAYHLKCLIWDVSAVYAVILGLIMFLYISIFSVVVTVFCVLLYYMVLLLRRNKQ